MPIDWNSDGTMIASSIGSKLKVLKIEGEDLVSMENIHHSELIRGFRWLKKESNCFLIAQNKPSKLLKYDRRDPNRFMG